jgi:hypothetical protein
MSKFEERLAQFERSLINGPIDFVVAPVVVEVIKPLTAREIADQRWLMNRWARTPEVGTLRPRSSKGLRRPPGGI